MISVIVRIQYFFSRDFIATLFTPNLIIIYEEINSANLQGIVDSFILIKSRLSSSVGI